ncbi:MAG TPA: hypothetical protein VL549_08260 [Gemmatimonadales bacterium]|jgi:hypothetical protein|nr:hypothetical protein [Gemmatimonadales bacterium]
MKAVVLGTAGSGQSLVTINTRSGRGRERGRERTTRVRFIWRFRPTCLLMCVSSLAPDLNEARNRPGKDKQAFMPKA